MQKNIAICAIILVTLGVIMASWLAFRCWKRRFKRELLVTYHIGKRRMPVKELASVQAPSTSTSSSGGPVERNEKPARKKRERRVTRETDAKQMRDYVSRQREVLTAPPAPPPPPTQASPPTTTTTANIPEDKGKQPDTSEWSADNPTPATEQSSPSVPAQGEWSSTSNAEMSSEWGQQATQSGPSRGQVRENGAQDRIRQ